MKNKEKSNIEKIEENIQDEKRTSNMTKKDVILMLIITFIYTIVSFINLGTATNPQTFWKTEFIGDSAIFRIEQGRSDVTNMRFYTGVDFGDYNISVSYDGITYADPLTINVDKVFNWQDYGLTGNFEYIKLEGLSQGLLGQGAYLGEFVVYGEDNKPLKLEPLNENAKLILDEQNTVPDEINYLNSTYFDEVYFPRTAYEHLHNLQVYEWTHPPLGKILMAIPMSIFGTSTLTYRFMGNLSGILMIPVIYYFAKLLFKESKYAVLAAIIMAADGMHFVQTRLGTADGFLVLFVILEYLFMYKYIISDEKPLKKKLLYLFLSGVFMGCAISVKWTGVFAGIGLALVFFFNLAIKIFVQRKKWNKEYTIIILSCFGFFVVIPLIIYIASFIPYYRVGRINNIKQFIEEQQRMYSYHHDLDATHPYSSKWYTWPITQQSMLYYWGTTNGGKNIMAITLLGNPAIWWFSLPCMAYTLITAISKRKFEHWFLVIPIISMLISYVGVDRIMFLYHYFPILPFVMLTIVAFAKWICEKIKNNAFIYIFVAVIVIVFIYFYPVYSGYPTTIEYIKDLKWLPTWFWDGI